MEQQPKIDLNKYRSLGPNERPISYSPGSKQFPDPEQSPAPVPPQEVRRREQEGRDFAQRRNAYDRQDFSFLDLFDQQMKTHKQAQEQFYQEEKQHQHNIEQQKPALFRQQEREEVHQEGFDQKKDEYEAWKKLQASMDTEFDPSNKSMEELREHFKISTDTNEVDHMNQKILELLYQRLRERQLKFYAFLNKEFNVMNFKSARCSMHCFDDEQKPIAQVNQCLSVCRSGIVGCRDFALGIQKKAEEEVDTCQTRAQDQKNLKDPIIAWASCYEKLLLRFDSMEQEIKEEFGHFI